MIPLIAGIGIGTILWTSRAVFLGGTAGMSYAIGKKVGRNACTFLDSLEGRARSMISSTVAPNNEE